MKINRDNLFFCCKLIYIFQPNFICIKLLLVNFFCVSFYLKLCTQVKKIYVPLPDEALRRLLLRHKLKGQAFSLPSENKLLTFVVFLFFQDVALTLLIYMLFLSFLLQSVSVVIVILIYHMIIGFSLGRWGSRKTCKRYRRYNVFRYSFF